MSLLDQLAEQGVWEEFLAHRLKKGRLTWRTFEMADAYVAEERYFPVVERLLHGYGMSIPQKHLVNKMGNGRKRVVYSFSDDEMNVLKAMSFLLYRYDSQLSPNCYSFRQGLTAHDALHQVLHTLGGRKMWAYKLDIHDYFNSIPIPLLLPILREVMADDSRLYAFFEQLLSDGRALFKGEIIQENRGVMAGTPISPFLANIYLMELDKHFAEAKVVYARYSDDIILFAPDRVTLEEHIAMLSAFLEKYQLQANPDKVRIFSPDEAFDFLGFKCMGRSIDIADATKRKIKDKIRRRTRSLLRWRCRKNVPADVAVKVLIKQFNKKFYESEDPETLTWSRWFFPMINRTDGLKEIDHYLQENIRFLATGKHNKANYRVRYSSLKLLGYRSLVHEFYADRKTTQSK
jgi:hypothetical protein